MDHARKAIVNMFGGEPLSYTRFSLARQPDGDTSHVEMKLAEDEEGTENGVIDHLPIQTTRPRRSNRNNCYLLLGVGLLLLIGFLIGYLSSRGQMRGVEKCAVDPCSSYQCTSESVEDQNEPEPEPEPVLHWNDLITLVSDKLRKTTFTDKVRDISATSLKAGSTEDEVLASKIHEQFAKFKLDKVWNDEHYMRLPVPGRSPNVVSLEATGETLEQRTAYVAYSGSGEASGKPVYVNYGREEDFRELLKRNFNLSQTVILVRAGEITFAEKVANAKKVGAVGVLIYPDPADYRNIRDDLALFGHAHLGTGDPFTPGFPSFNHTQFPPAQSSGLPLIPVQTISASDARKLLSLMNGAECPDGWKGILNAPCKLASNAGGSRVKLRVNNGFEEKKILNIFGVIKGLEEPDRYIVLGAQRDAWDLGAVQAGVGTALLLELARILADMVKTDGYRPRRSVVFASWSAGAFGAVGATEWLEGYASSLHLKAFAYINLDSAVTGSTDFRFSASPMLKKLLREAVAGVQVSGRELRAILAYKGVPFRLDDAAFPFLAYSGIPSVSFRFTNGEKEYPFLGTTADNLDRLLSNFNRDSGQLDNTMRKAAEIAARMALWMTHDHELYLDYESYTNELRDFVGELAVYQKELKSIGLDTQWLFGARGDFTRATTSLTQDVKNTDLTNKVACRALNDRIMKVEYNFLSPYVSPKETPLRHVFFGSGPHTLAALLDHLKLLRSDRSACDEALLKNQLALATWTVQSAANALAGDIWNIDNEF